ncbi:hypothetical protein M5X00_28110 [Paenibacillus alvei]|uniref:Uncharacterized protein n=1 Tax=Paenibacillus alvei TaxID=44250 RepID=A0ABT4H275_PAEAL|nr:hypothetical protein [Paenibacillus alvei]EJW15620.1 hypothetical protein PAV_8c02890 [Paenibacillus alvei DSM 29]MCY9542610.1 hypothetical protein [Paenibacillus alvei]MCY9706499.1 hypothetical protein [Paenibacillus alvei]MCY9736470.1 hypothetical protein [Paenibacillus alvei]MCY9758095.1 hypothetical protein [Paenibacillus alvei]
MITHLNVALDPQGHEGLRSVRIDEIVSMEFNRFMKGVVIHTSGRNYFLPGSLSYWVKGLNNSGHTFEFIGKGKAVNTKNVKYVDTQKCDKTSP